VRDRLKPDHFFEAVHARLYEVIDTFAAAGKIASPFTIKNHFDQDGTLADIGGMRYLANLVSNAAVQISLKQHVELLRDLAARRLVMTAAHDLSCRASTVSVHEPFRAVIAAHIDAMQKLFEAGSGRQTTYLLGEALAASVEQVRRVRAGEADSNVISTGIASVDKFTGGLHLGEYGVLGGRPSMGKTALAIQLAYNVAERGGGVFYASLEMAAPLLTPRFASCRLWSPELSIPYQRILRGDVDDRIMRWLESAAKEMNSWPLIIDDDAGLTAAELEARAQIAKVKLERTGKPLDLVVADHIHKLHHPDALSKVAEYTAISGRLAEMAKRLSVPVLALAQLNRRPEERDDKRPQLADLRESGSIEQDADTVLFVYRPAYYLERKRCSKPVAEADRLADLEAVAHSLELIVEKQRSGPIGTIKLCCNMAANVVRDPTDCGVRFAT
jgi:replicative DNA helicase